MVEPILRRVAPTDYSFIISKLKLNMIRGIVAKDAKCYVKGQIGPPFLTAQQITFLFNPLGWWRKSSVLYGAKVEGATINLILDNIDPETGELSYESLIIENVNATFKTDRATKITVQNFTGDFADLTLKANGILLPPARTKRVSTKDESSEPDQGTALLNFYKFFRQFSFDTRTTVVLDFIADPYNVHDWDIKLATHSDGISFQEHRLDSFDLKAHFKGSTGELLLNVEGLNLQKMPVEKLQAWITINEMCIIIRSISGIAGNGTRRGPYKLNGRYDMKTHIYTGKARSGFDPNATTDLLKEFDLVHQANAIRDFKFETDLPVVSGHLIGKAFDKSWFKMIGVAQFENATYSDVFVRSAKSSIYFDISDYHSLMANTPIHITRPEGYLNGHMLMNFNNETLDFNCESTLHPMAIAQAIGPFMTEIVENIDFQGPVRIVGSGTAGYEDLEKTDLELTLEARNAGTLGFIAEEVSGKLRVTGTMVDLTDIKGNIYGGPFSAIAAVYPVGPESNVFYEVTGQVQNASFEQILAALEQKQA
ncbi:MAG: hypothetical protein GX811_02400, partial [Lentisphaerae bacterium]|nr:hypothetical protein [Lentisphaerota bacterium]